MKSNNKLPEGILTDEKSFIWTQLDEKGISCQRLKKENPTDEDVTTVSREIMKIICGGEFPKDPKGFCFDEVDHFKPEGGVLVAYVRHEPIGPNLKIVIAQDSLS